MSLGLQKKKRKSHLQTQTYPPSCRHWCAAPGRDSRRSQAFREGLQDSWLLCPLLFPLIDTPKHDSQRGWQNNSQIVWGTFSVLILLGLMLEFMVYSKISSSGKLAFPRVFCPGEVLPQLVSVFPPGDWCPLTEERFSWPCWRHSRSWQWYSSHRALRCF